jgi:hypothetical protein
MGYQFRELSSKFIVKIDADTFPAMTLGEKCSRRGPASRDPVKWKGREEECERSSHNQSKGIWRNWVDHAVEMEDQRMGMNNEVCL